MPTDKNEITYSEYVYRRHKFKYVFPKNIGKKTRKGVFLRCIIRSNYLFPDFDAKGIQKTDNYLIKSTLSRRLVTFEKLPRELQTDFAKIMLKTLFKAYENEDRLRMIDLIIRQTRNKIYDPKEPFDKTMNNQLKGIDQVTRNRQNTIQIYTEKRESLLKNIFPQYKIDDIKDNIGRATGSFLQACQFLVV